MSATAGYWLNEKDSTWNAFLKGGIGLIDSNANYEEYHDKQHSTQLVVGAGVQWRFYENSFLRFEIDSVDKDTKFIGFTLAFTL